MADLTVRCALVVSFAPVGASTTGTSFVVVLDVRTLFRIYSAAPALHTAVCVRIVNLAYLSKNSDRRYSWHPAYYHVGFQS